MSDDMQAASNSRTAVKWNPVGVIEEFIGEELTSDIAKRIETWPEDHRLILAQRLSEDVARLSTQDEEAEPTGTDQNVEFGQLDMGWYEPGASFAFPVSTLKQQLFYLPCVVLKDRFASLLGQSIGPEAAVFPKEVNSTGKTFEVKSPFDWWLESLCEVLPGLRQKCVELFIPAGGKASAVTLNIAHQTEKLTSSALIALFRALAADLEMSLDPSRAFERISVFVVELLEIDDPVNFFHGLADAIEKADQNEVEMALNQTIGEALTSARESRLTGKSVGWESAVVIAEADARRGILQSEFVQAFASHLQLGVRSLFGSRYAEALIAQYGLMPFDVKVRTSVKQKQAGQLLSRYRLPAIANVTFAEVVALRENQKAFATFRRLLGDLLHQIDEFNPADQRQFETEFEQAMEDIMQPAIQGVLDATKSSIYDKVFVPTGLALSGGAMVLGLTGVFPPAAIVAAGLAPAGFAADALRKRYKKSGTEAHRLSTAYLTLAKAAKV